MTLHEIAVIIDLVTLLVLIASAWLLLAQIRSDQEWNRRKAANDLLFQATHEFRSLRRGLEERINIYDPSQSYLSAGTSLTAEDHRALDAVLNFLETVCVAVKNGVVDEDLVYSVFGGILCRYWGWSAHYVRLERGKNELLWVEIDPFAKRWQARTDARLELRVEPGKPRL